MWPVLTLPALPRNLCLPTEPRPRPAPSIIPPPSPSPPHCLIKPNTTQACLSPVLQMKEALSRPSRIRLCRRDGGSTPIWYRCEYMTLALGSHTDNYSAYETSAPAAAASQPRAQQAYNPQWQSTLPTTPASASLISSPPRKSRLVSAEQEECTEVPTTMHFLRRGRSLRPMLAQGPCQHVPCGRCRPRQSAHPLVSPSLAPLTEKISSQLPEDHSSGSKPGYHGTPRETAMHDVELEYSPHPDPVSNHILRGCVISSSGNVDSARFTTTALPDVFLYMFEWFGDALK
ncbi:hypothetical protein F5148DRAFT_1152320 [Russula earlei]|uniref:Uncharacterized protein n=1 Tax=Russula earlei TaxID=71964 RepID=A0ACC0TZ15_9AGAM|nr:hypothetical protein F5148DRAFT_1152320 [Russula earlei]